MRLAGRFYTDGKRVVSVKLRVTARDIPSGAEVQLTDVQLQAGTGHSGYAFAPEDIDIRPRSRHYVNGTINESQPVMLLANMLVSSGTRLEVLDGAGGEVRLGTYRFGSVIGSAVADGETHEADQGWGRVPIITERSDLQLYAHVTERIHVRATWRDIVDSKDPKPVPPVDEGAVLSAHATWNQVLNFHPSWADVLATHTDWS